MQINAYFKIITRNANGINSSIKKRKNTEEQIGSENRICIFAAPPPRNITLDE